MAPRRAHTHAAPALLAMATSTVAFPVLSIVALEISPSFAPSTDARSHPIRPLR